MTTDATNSRRSILSGDSVFARLGLRSGELLVLAVAFFFCTAIGPFFVFPSYTARMALILFTVVPGVCVLVQRARLGDRAALAASTLAAWIVLAALLSGAPRLALFGVAGRESSALVAVAALGLWALGGELSERARQFLVPVLFAGLLLNAVVGPVADAADDRLGHALPSGGASHRADDQPGLLRLAHGGRWRSPPADSATGTTPC